MLAPFRSSGKKEKLSGNLDSAMSQRILSALDCEQSSSDSWHANCYF
jgi:hypothetical protein